MIQTKRQEHYGKVISIEIKRVVMRQYINIEYEVIRGVVLQLIGH